MIKNRGFSQIELLVVTGVIALALVFGYPCLQRIRQEERATACKNQVGQIVSLLNQFQQNNGTYPYGFNDDLSNLMTPPPGNYLGNACFDRTGWWWQQYLDQYSGPEQFGAEKLFRCPSRQITGEFAENPLWGNYGVNQMICKASQEYSGREHLAGVPLGLGHIKRPQEMLLVMDSGYNLINWTHVTAIPPYPMDQKIDNQAYLPGLSLNRQKEIHPRFLQDAVRGRHAGRKVNGGFCDGRVKNIAAQTLEVKWDNGVYNNLGMWQEESTFSRPPAPLSGAEPQTLKTGFRPESVEIDPALEPLTE